MVRPCPKNGPPLTPTHCSHLDTRRKEETRSPEGDMGEELNDSGLRTLAGAFTGGGSITSRR